MTPTAAPTPCTTEQYFEDGVCIECGCGNAGSCEFTTGGLCECDALYFGTFCDNRFFLSFFFF